MPSLSHQAVLVSRVTSPTAEAVAPDTEVLADLRAGDTAAFAAIVDDWSRVMLHVARRYVRDQQAAEDVVQEAWLGVMTGLPRFEGRSSLRSWTFSILINRAKTQHGKERRLVASAAPTGSEARETVHPRRLPGPDGE